MYLINFLLPVDDVDVAVGIHVGHVAGVEPPVLYGLGGGLGVAPVALHNLGSADDQLADLAGGKLTRTVFGVDDFFIGVRGWRADGAGASARGIYEIHVCDGGGLGEAVALDSGDAG